MRLDKSDIRYVIDYIKYIFFIIMALYSKVFKCFILFHSKASKNMNYWLSSTACAKNFILVDILFWIIIVFLFDSQMLRKLQLILSKMQMDLKGYMLSLKRKNMLFITKYIRKRDVYEKKIEV